MIYKKIEEFFDKYFEIILKIALIINVVMIVILFPKDTKLDKLILFKTPISLGVFLVQKIM